MDKRTTNVRVIHLVYYVTNLFINKNCLLVALETNFDYFMPDFDSAEWNKNLPSLNGRKKHLNSLFLNSLQRLSHYRNSNLSSPFF